MKHLFILLVLLLVCCSKNPVRVESFNETQVIFGSFTDGDLYAKSISLNNRSWIINIPFNKLISIHARSSNSICIDIPRVDTVNTYINYYNSICIWQELEHSIYDSYVIVVIDSGYKYRIVMLK